MTSSSPYTPATQNLRFTGFAAVGAFVAVGLVFYIYQIALRFGLMPAFLGGYVGAIGYLLLPIMLFVYLREGAARPKSLNRSDMLLFSWVAMLVFIATIYFISDSSNMIARSHLVFAPQYVVYYIIFKYLPFDSRFARLAIWASFSLMSVALIFLNLGEISLEVVLANRFLDEGSVANYQAYAQIYFLVLVCCICISPNLAIRMIVYALGTVALFYNGARSELIVLLPTAIVAEAFLSRRLVLVAIILLGYGALFSGPIYEYLIAVLPENRFTWLLSDLSYDQSWVEREMARSNAIDVISSSPIFGRYASYPEGYYSHDFLSVWADFGLFGMLLFATAMLLPLLSVIGGYLRRRTDGQMIALACFSFAAVIFFAFAKTYTHPIFAVSLAFYGNYLTTFLPERNVSRHE